MRVTIGLQRAHTAQKVLRATRRMRQLRRNSYKLLIDSSARTAGALACSPVCRRSETHGGSWFAASSRTLLSHSAARNSSLIDVLARVCASTRFTITAQYKPYLPSAEGSVPGTTTDPAGTRPWRMVLVVRS